MIFRKRIVVRVTSLLVLGVVIFTVPKVFLFLPDSRFGKVVAHRMMLFPMLLLAFFGAIEDTEAITTSSELLHHFIGVAVGTGQQITFLLEIGGILKEIYQVGDGGTLTILLFFNVGHFQGHVDLCVYLFTVVERPSSTSLCGFCCQSICLKTRVFAITPNRKTRRHTTYSSHPLFVLFIGRNVYGLAFPRG